MKRILGLDIGDVRVGVAVSDPLMITAQGLDTYTRGEDGGDAAYFLSLKEKYGFDTIVCGLPKNMDGTLGFQAQKVQAFAEMLKDALDVRVVYWDERLTSKSAHAALREGGVAGAKRKGAVDKIAAVYILQGYMDANGPGGL